MFCRSTAATLLKELSRSLINKQQQKAAVKVYWNGNFCVFDMAKQSKVFAECV